jgi:hypothetical protein
MALVAGGDDPQRAGGGGQRTAVLPVGDQDQPIKGRRIEFGKCKNHLIAVGSFGEQLRSHRFLMQSLAELHPYSLKDVSNRDAFVRVFFAVATPGAQGLPRELIQVGPRQ